MPRVPKPYRGQTKRNPKWQAIAEFEYKTGQSKRPTVTSTLRRITRMRDTQKPGVKSQRKTRRPNIPVRAKMILRERYATRAKLIKTRRGGMKPQGR